MTPTIDLAFCLSTNRRLHTRDTLIEKLKAQLALLRRARYGASSEKVERTIDPSMQLKLRLGRIKLSLVLGVCVFSPCQRIFIG